MIKIKKIDINLKNFFQLQVNVSAEGEQLSYAYYLYRNKEVINKSSYSAIGTIKYNLSEPGTYYVRVFVKDKEGKQLIDNSEKIAFKAFPNQLIAYESKPLIIFGISKMSATVKFILQAKFKVDFFATNDSVKAGMSFFGIPIINIEDLNSLYGYKIIVVDEFDERTKDRFISSGLNYEVFLSNFSESNEVFKTLHNLSALQIYNLARSCYLEGLTEGANLLKSFIHYKFNSIIPYTAEIGEGTRLGYGGIGVVIHVQAVIGKNCVISQNVTIGARDVKPVIGDNVFIGPGSKCIGGKIGSNVVIGANSVVTKEIKDNSVVAGVPAKVISTQINKYKSYLKNS